MINYKKDMERIRELTGDAFIKANTLAAIADSKGIPYPQKLHCTLEQILDSFEQSTLELRILAERNSPGVGGYGNRPELPIRDVTGTVNIVEYSWLHITLKTLLPHCRYQTPAWLIDTLRRMLDDFEASGGVVPCFRNGAALFIDEWSDVSGRHIYDQDNKGWKAVSNALKGRVFPDDDQYSLGVMLLSYRSRENVTHITVVDMVEAGDFLSLRNGSSTMDIYSEL